MLRTLLVASVVLAAALRAAPQDNLFLLEAPHFDVYYSSPERDTARQVAVLAERSYAELSRLFQRGLDRRHTLVLYPTPSRYRAEVIAGGMLSAASGGVTHGERATIAMPVGITLADTSHVVSHELVHAFQYEAAARANPPFPALPPWFVEGMAEHLALGADDPGVLTWARDASRHARGPALSDLSDARRLPYLSGHGAWRFLIGRFGPDVARELLAAPGDRIDGRLSAVTGLTGDELSAAWRRSLRDEFGTGRRDLGRVMVRDGVAPSLSPDGNLLAWTSPGEPASLWLLDAHSGVVRHQLLDPARNPRYDSLHPVDSTGAWDPQGRRLAFAASRGGRPLVAIVHAASGRLEREIPFDRPGEIIAPAWSPDGHRLAFSGLAGGKTDLYVYDLVASTVRQLTADAYAELQPAWSPDGATLVFATDRFTTDLAALRPGALRLAAIDVATGKVREIAGTPGGRSFNPGFGRDGDDLVFVADPDGSPAVYRLSLTRGEATRVTPAGVEVTGLTPSSPAVSVTRGGAIAYSVFRDGRYQIALQ
jgi:hypothetical protein